MELLLLAAVILTASGVVALALYRWPRLASALAAAGAVVGCALGLVPAWQALTRGALPTLTREWAAPVGTFVIGLDPLSAFFLVPLLVLGALTAVYGREYLLAYRDHKALAPPAFFFNLLVASMIGVVAARDGVLLLIAWELMTLAAYALVCFEYEDAAVKRAGWVYLIASHIAVACLFAMFLILGNDSFAFSAFGARGGTAVVVFVLALVGFGTKAGIVPLHVWLPEAHAAAPSHVSALMSGVLIKMGVYGILRVMTFLPQALWCAWTLIVLGAVGALLGISLAMYQRDLKRTLAYSSIENVGLILLALGIGLVGVCRGDGRMAALGLLGGLFHVWNHVLMKGLMFLSAGSIVHGTGTRDLERMGGLMKRMPATSALMVFGAVAISGLPPLNGFASEWLIYLGLIQGGVHGAGARSTLILLLVGLLAFVGGLAVLCFVRIIGVALLGSPRAKLEAHESSPWMTGPMALLAAAAAVAALFPSRVLGLLAPVATQLGAPAGTLAPVAASTAWLGNGAALIWLSLGVLGLALALWSRRPAADQTWGCGYVAPTPRMQYTARSFTEVMAERLLPSILGPRVRRKPPEGIFPSSGEWSAESDDPVMRSVYEPFLDRWARRFSQLRWLQQGVLHVYILYILVVLLAALGWMSARNWSFS